MPGGGLSINGNSRLTSVACRLVGLAILLLAPFLVAFGPPGITQSDSLLAPFYPSDLKGMQSIRPPSGLTAEAAVIMDATTGRVVFDKNAHVRRAPASITKIMTAIVAIENGNLADRVTVPRIDLPEEASMGLLWGDVMTLEDLLWGLLLPSGNDAATVIAYHVGGASVDNFIKAMNEKAAQLGMKDSHFITPHGLDEDGHYSSAYDIAVMARYAMNIPIFAKIVGTRSYVLRASRTFYLTNSNFLLRPQNESIGADGIKTGYTDDAGDSIAASATRDGRRVIVVALDTADRTAEAIKLFNYAFSTYEWVDMSLPPYLVASNGDGKPKPIALKDSSFEYMLPWQARRLVPTVKLNGGANLQPGQPAGSASYWDGQGTIADLPVIVR